MSVKGELSDGFPQPKPAFIITFVWDAAHKLGPTKNNLSYVKFNGKFQPAYGSDFPPFAADFVDAGAWLQEDVLPSGQIWLKVDAFVLLRAVEPPIDPADPVAVEAETGLIRVKWHGGVNFSEVSKPALLVRDIPGLMRVVAKEDEPGNGGGGVMTCSFETSDHRYKYLEHAVYVGKYKLLTVSTEEGDNNVVYQVKVSYLAA